MCTHFCDHAQIWKCMHEFCTYILWNLHGYISKNLSVITEQNHSCVFENALLPYCCSYSLTAILLQNPWPKSVRSVLWGWGMDLFLDRWKDRLGQSLFFIPPAWDEWRRLDGRLISIITAEPWPVSYQSWLDFLRPKHWVGPQQIAPQLLEACNQSATAAEYCCIVAF